VIFYIYMKNKILKILEKNIKELYPQNDLSDILKNFEINIPDKKEFGHYSTNISFKLAPLIKKSPIQIAEDLKQNILKSNSFIFEKIEVANPGFLNFWINKFFYF